MNRFNKDDRVIGVCNSDGLDINGQHGVILEVCRDGSIKVLFDNRFNERLHSKYKRCWYVADSEIDFEPDTFMYEVNEEMFSSIIG